MFRYIVFFVRTLLFSVGSLFQGIIHIIYEKLLPGKKSAPLDELNLLVLQLGQIGDFVLSLPHFEALKKFYGNKLNLTVMIDPINTNLARDNHNIDNIVFYNRLKYNFKSDRTARLKFPREALKSRIFDRVIWLRGDVTIFCWILRAGIPLKSITKFPNPLRWSWLPLITQRPVTRQFKHYLECLDNLDENAKATRFAWCQKKNYSRPVNLNGSKNVYIHIAAGSELRKWPDENFSALCMRLLAWDDRISISLLGSYIDSGIADRIINLVLVSGHANRINNICDKVALQELSMVLTNGDLYIGFDSGPMHIAASVGIPIVALMGPQSPQLFSPWGKQKIRIIYKNYYCSPCWQFACLHEKEGAGACVKAIHPMEVFNAARSILGEEV